MGSSTVKREIIIPAYYGMWSAAGVESFKKIIRVAGDLSEHFNFNVILNPSNGPGQIEDQLLPQYDIWISEALSLGIKLYGYIHCKYGGVPIAQIVSQRDLYLSHKITGVFIDQAPSRQVTYLQSIRKKFSYDVPIIFNPGTISSGLTNFLREAREVSPTVVITYEGPISTIDTFPDQAFEKGAGALIYDYPFKLEGGLANDFSKYWNRVEYLFVTQVGYKSGVKTENPWTDIDDQFVSALHELTKSPDLFTNHDVTVPDVTPKEEEPSQPTKSELAATSDIILELQKISDAVHSLELSLLAVGNNIIAKLDKNESEP
jgi:hypothetical protein